MGNYIFDTLNGQSIQSKKDISPINISPSLCQKSHNTSGFMFEYRRSNTFMTETDCCIC